MFRFKPQGRYIADWTQFSDGQSVEGYRTPWNAVFRRNVKDGHIRLETNRKYGLVSTDIWLDWKGRAEHLGWYHSDILLHKSTLDKFALYKVNKLTSHKKGNTMANKLLSALKLNKEQRKLSKVGVYDENGNLTEDGTELLLNWLAKENEAKLVLLVKDFTADKKKCKDEES